LLLGLAGDLINPVAQLKIGGAERLLGRQRASPFFGAGCMAHVSMAHPVSPRLRIHLAEAARVGGIQVVRDGTYVCMEGRNSLRSPKASPTRVSAIR
jgi:hypothetical protein